jgi:Fe-S oxidoreductase/uncharacterized membrane protein YdjX (TVP38/TMEM64 family)
VIALGVFPLLAEKLTPLHRRRLAGTAAEAAASTDSPVTSTEISALRRQIDCLQADCTRCGTCRSHCAFLQKYGLPGQIAGSYDFNRADHKAIAYECSLCNLCGAVCPQRLNPTDFFLAVRREAAAAGQVDLSRYGAILGYEKRGASALFSYYGLPTGCDTILFPGCTLPGTRPDTTWQLFGHLRRDVPNLGIILDCCTKPSHDLGRQSHVMQMFGEMRRYLVDRGVRTVLVACPNCHKMFKQYGHGLAVRTVYEHIDVHRLPHGGRAAGELTIHDPCPMREESAVQDAVRSILTKMGLSVSEMKHGRKRALCCGEGGCVGFVQPDLARRWSRIRREEAGGRKIVTYCTGCAGVLSRSGPVVHIADLLFNPEQSMNGGPRVAKSPFTYINRLRLKQRFKKSISPAVQRVRTLRSEGRPRSAKDAYGPKDCKRSLRNKGLATAAILLVGVLVFFVIRHFMYILDSYLYTAEFHGIFMKDNLRQANTTLFTQYFRSLGLLEGLPFLIIAHLFQTVLAPFSRSILTPAAIHAYGPAVGALYIFISDMIVGWLAFGLGRFFFGEILPLVRKTRAPLSAWIYPAMSLMTAIPVIPVALPAAIGAIARTRLKSFTLIMATALVVRLIWELLLPGI